MICKFIVPMHSATYGKIGVFGVLTRILRLHSKWCKTRKPHFSPTTREMGTLVLSSREKWTNPPFREYLHMNPVRRRLVSTAAEYPYCSAHPSFELDGLPQRLKPGSQVAIRIAAVKPLRHPKALLSARARPELSRRGGATGRRETA
jgi:hypothetical protein